MVLVPRCSNTSGSHLYAGDLNVLVIFEIGFMNAIVPIHQTARMAYPSLRGKCMSYGDERLDLEISSF